MPYTENTSSEITTTTTEQTGCCGSSGLKLIFPKQIIPSQRRIIARLLSSRPEQAQTIVDELAGRMKATDVPNPIGYIKGILKNIGDDEIEPELALGVAESRAAKKKREEENRNAIRQMEAKRSHREESVISPTKQIQNLRDILKKGGC